MTEDCDSSVESDDESFESKFGQDCHDILLNYPYPNIQDFLTKVKKHFKWQNKKINKLRNKLNNQKENTREGVINQSKELTDKSIQTDDVKSSTEWDVNCENSTSITEQVKQVAETALQHSGFIFEETSGLYYDYNSGYYYDSTQGLYYDGNTGTYYCYNEQTKTYEFHSQTTQEQNVEKIENQNKEEKRKKRKAKMANKDDAKRKHCDDEHDNGTTEEPEEGLCTTSESSESSDDNSSSSDNEVDNEKDPKAYPPCMRIIVKETSIPKLKIGTLFVVTYTGGTLGREGDHSVLIQDINISKHHAKFQYDESKKQYELIDMGSRNGTYLNNKRLSVAKQESEPFEVSHGSIVQVGSTKLLCHIHTGHDTCGHCEPGLIQQHNNIENSSITKQVQHKSELKRLKQKFGVEKDNTIAASAVASGYQDRAQARKAIVGSSNQHAKTQQSSVDTSIAKDNKGFKLLSKMGWNEGQSLGKNNDGRTEPVPLMGNNSKVGLGASTVEYDEVDDPKMKKKNNIWRKTRERYDGLSQL